MSCENNSKPNCCLFESLCENVNSVVTISTEGGCLFCGLLVSVSCECCKIITNSCNTGCPSSRRFGSCYGKVTIIPLDQITSVTFCNTEL